MKPIKAKHRDTLYNNGLTPEQNRNMNIRTANFTIKSEMKAQDSLPKILRDAINDSSIVKWSSVTVVELVKEIQNHRPEWNYDQCVQYAALCIKAKNESVYQKACQQNDLYVKPVQNKVIKKKEYLL